MFLAILGLILTVVLNVGVPALLLSFAFSFTFLKAVAIVLAARIILA